MHASPNPDSPAVLALCSSPRTPSNSEILADRALAGAAARGAQIEKLRLHEMDIRPCTGCDACQVDAESECWIRDDMPGVLAKIRRADALILASPIYFFSVNAQMKLTMDRLYSLFSREGFDALAGKRVAVVLTYGDPDTLSSGARNALGMFRDACRFLQMELVGWVHAPCGRPGEVQANTLALDAARNLGQKLVGR